MHVPVHVRAVYHVRNTKVRPKSLQSEEISKSYHQRHANAISDAA